MAWLGAAFKKLLIWIGPELIKLVVGAVQDAIAKYRARKENERKAREAREASEKAKTKEEKDAAAKASQQNW